uniref:N-acetyltransferase domain-containing protein n=1 Tax=Chromera velia CCMP2878 TaxID=1169474 RepID=A0A0G4IAY7_9ALVE|eukprot:Cvel_2125.t1-p1 / transcript=Cvel_2125.t1 / gene=Cvel_2125 / organism=Chromera_velia_CCMP2878 / gene_product=hypothetical protein / transcript_product=hypothetical protein / location=Cvel_scaffold82:50890-52626(+) / protein_length=384 / sequence_SO=supercontig / SO=protein_coding / is_pseudo=false
MLQKQSAVPSQVEKFGAPEPRFAVALVASGPPPESCGDSRKLCAEGATLTACCLITRLNQLLLWSPEEEGSSLCAEGVRTLAKNLKGDHSGCFGVRQTETERRPVPLVASVRGRVDLVSAFLEVCLSFPGHCKVVQAEERAERLMECVRYTMVESPFPEGKKPPRGFLRVVSKENEAEAILLACWYVNFEEEVSLARYCIICPHASDSFLLLVNYVTLLPAAPVYTPPERRGCGFASALVAGMTSLALNGKRESAAGRGRRCCVESSEELIKEKEELQKPPGKDSGFGLSLTADLKEKGQCQADGPSRSLSESKAYEWVYLFTDPANPTSNKVYEACGFRPVSHWKTVKLQVREQPRAVQGPEPSGDALTVSAAREPQSEQAGQ